MFGCRGVLRSALCPVFVCACCEWRLWSNTTKWFMISNESIFDQKGPKCSRITLHPQNKTAIQYNKSTLGNGHFHIKLMPKCGKIGAASTAGWGAGAAIFSPVGKGVVGSGPVVGKGSDHPRLCNVCITAHNAMQHPSGPYPSSTHKIFVCVCTDRRRLQAAWFCIRLGRNASRLAIVLGVKTHGSYHRAISNTNFESISPNERSQLL